MSRAGDDESTGNSEKDWEIFDILVNDGVNVSSTIREGVNFFYFWRQK